MATFNINTFEKDKNYVLEASAGTGKTHNIIEIVNKLVRDYKIKLEEIVITTYTEKAAGELKERTREKLPEQDSDNAYIGTIHSFCSRIIKEFALSANKAAKLETIDEKEVIKFIKQWLRCGNISKDIIKIKSSNKKRLIIDTLIDYFYLFIDKYYLDYEYKQDPNIVSISNEDKTIFHIYMKIIDSLEAKQDVFNNLYNSFPDIKVNHDILSNSSREKLREFADELKKNASLFFVYEGVKYKKNKAYSLEENEAIEYFKYLKENLDNPYIILINKYIDDLYREWQEYKYKNKKQTFNDMLRNVREEILHNPTFKKKLKDKFKYAIIDEFQDTNRKEFDIFKEIFMDDQHHITVVGDPKQSIYAFQGADINVYYDAVKEIIDNGGLKFELDKNFRSSVSMVESCNNLFADYNFAGTTFFESNHLDRNKKLENGNKEKEPVAYYMQQPTKAFWIATNNIFVDEESGYELSKEETIEQGSINPELFSRIVAEQIIDCCSLENGHTKLQIQNDANDDSSKRDVSFKDFTILARSRSELENTEKALKEVGIPYIKYKDNSLFLGRECAHWIALLEAIELPDYTGYNRNKVLKAFNTDFFGYKLKDLKNPKFGFDDTEEFILMAKWNKLANEEKWDDLFDDIVVSSKLTKTLSALKHMQSLAKYKQIGDHCVDFLTSGHSLNELIVDLRTSNNNEEDAMSEIVKRNSDFDSVQLMTIHASKGLQFPIVIVPGGYKQTRTDKIFSYRTKDKKHISIIKPKTYDDDVENEIKRLFYVAYTRAIYIMILPLYSEFTYDFLKKGIEKMFNQKDDVRLITSSLERTRDLSKKVHTILNRNKHEESQEKKEEQKEKLEQLIHRTYNIANKKHSYASLSHNHTENDELETESGAIVENIKEFDGLEKYDRHGICINCDYDQSLNLIQLPDDYPKGAFIGTALHEVFEKVDFTNYQTYVKETIRRCFKNYCIDTKDEWLDATVKLVNNVLTSNLPVVHGSSKTDQVIKLNTINNENKNAEAEFNFNNENEHLGNYFNGFIDLIFRNGDYYSIVDWKTDSLNEDFNSYADQSQLRQHVDEKYSIQRTIYAYCLINWLKSFINKTEEEIFNYHFGGIYYIFIRGCIKDSSNGIYCHTWRNYQELRDSFNEIVRDRIELGAK